jgi:hypothetical protein
MEKKGKGYLSISPSIHQSQLQYSTIQAGAPNKTPRHAMPKKSTQNNPRPIHNNTSHPIPSSIHSSIPRLSRKQVIKRILQPRRLLLRIPLIIIFKLRFFKQLRTFLNIPWNIILHCLFPLFLCQPLSTPYNVV